MTVARILQLEQKVAIITGSTRGIGLATARLMAEAGAKVVISSRKAAACETTVQQLREAGHDAIAVPCHMAKPEERTRLVARTLDHFDRIDVLIANAAINPVLASPDAVPPELWSKVLETNLMGPLHLFQLVLPTFVRQGGGAVVFVSAIASLAGNASSGAYGVSKAALNQLGRDLAVAWGPKNVRVNTVVPGGTLTDMVRNLISTPEDLVAATRDVPLGRLGDPEDVAAAIVFLAGRGGRQITGQTIVVDGGASVLGTGPRTGA